MKCEDVMQMFEEWVDRYNVSVSLEKDEDDYCISPLARRTFESFIGGVRVGREIAADE